MIYALENFTNFVFQNAEEEAKETPCRNSVPALKTEPADHSEPSAPCSPTTPQDDSDSKPVLCTANSTTDQEQLPDSSDVVTGAGNDAVCTSTTDSGQLNKDLTKSLSECLVEMNTSAGSGRNTPSPCPSTAGKCLELRVHSQITVLLTQLFFKTNSFKPNQGRGMKEVTFKL